MKRLARLRDCFLAGRDPRAAVFCTYGFEAAFFEAEVLPALLENSLGLDRRAGSKGAYLNAADTALQARDLCVFYDHLGEEGPELTYAALRVDSGGGAFHPKLTILDYEDRIRAIVGSANVSRAAWTSQLELFVAEDLFIGTPHSWARPLQSFLAATADRARGVRPSAVDRIDRRLAEVPESTTGSRLLSSFDGPLFSQITANLEEVTRIDAVTPFFEGEEGEGVFTAIEGTCPTARVRLFVSAQEGASQLVVHGPREKLEPLLSSGAWTLHRVRDVWSGDDNEAQRPRALHGKLLIFTGRQDSRVIVGSANLTRSALLQRPPAGNVELVTVTDMQARAASVLLPEHDDLPQAEVVIEAPPPEDDQRPLLDASRWIESATYSAAAGQLELAITDGSPPLEFHYDGVTIGEGVVPPAWICQLTLGNQLYVEVFDGDVSGIVPLQIRDPEAFQPRGSPSRLTFDDFLDILAGARSLPASSDDESTINRSRAGGAGADVLPRITGPIAWRKLMAAVDGLVDELVQEAPYDKGVRFLLRNPSRLAGLLERLEAARTSSYFTDADHAFALHAIRSGLARAAAAMAAREECGPSRVLVEESLGTIAAAFDRYRTTAEGDLRVQLDLLSQEVAC